jgi:3-keto-5-aminohexanoate cleavage enzyme
MIMGVHVRMGMEDSVWKYPHSDEMIKNNAETLQWAFQMAKLLGREVMTPNEYRETVLKKPARFDHAETLRPME